MLKSIKRFYSFLHVISKHFFNKIYLLFRWIISLQYSSPIGPLYLWKIKRVIRLRKLFNLLLCRSSNNLYYLNKLFNRAIAWKQGIESHQFHNYAASRPHIYFTPIRSRIKQKLWCSVVSGTNIRNIILVFLNNLRWAEIAYL